MITRGTRETGYGTRETGYGTRGWGLGVRDWGAGVGPNGVRPRRKFPSWFRRGGTLGDGVVKASCFTRGAALRVGLKN
jgi:hypothetical protein